MKLMCKFYAIISTGTVGDNLVTDSVASFPGRFGSGI